MLIMEKPRPSRTTERAPAGNRSRGDAEMVTPSAVNEIAFKVIAEAITANRLSPQRPG
jgi:hypothetical protein